jgi:FkbM family methyltransferase
MLKHLVTQHDDLIYDVGMHKGEDTEFYLRKGFRVIAFEADPDLIGYCKGKFSAEIKDNKLVIVEGAILDNPKLDKVLFYKCVDVSVWGTIDINWAKRNERRGKTIETIEVDTVDFSECVHKYGIPYYMKIDIEGADIICLKQLLYFNPKPHYVSIESNKISMKGIHEEISLLEKLGYSEFKAIQQYHISKTTVPYPPKEGVSVSHQFPPGPSGLFGKELPGKWKSKKDILKEYKFILLNYRLFGDDGLARKIIILKLIKRLMQLITRGPVPGWYDTHAKHSLVHNY